MRPRPREVFRFRREFAATRPQWSWRGGTTRRARRHGRGRGGRAVQLAWDTSSPHPRAGEHTPTLPSPRALRCLPRFVRSARARRACNEAETHTARRAAPLRAQMSRPSPLPEFRRPAARQPGACAALFAEARRAVGAPSARNEAKRGLQARRGRHLVSIAFFRARATGTTSGLTRAMLFPDATADRKQEGERR